MGSSGGPRRARRARLGFLGVGWNGRSRLRALSASDAAEVSAIADIRPECRAEAAPCAPGARLCGSLGELLGMGLDGIVIATPSALHPGQAVAALESGAAVFCQKPLARTTVEARRVIDAARRADRLLGVDLSYRYTTALRALRRLVASGQLGRIYAADLVFHNAYGPDKPWCYDKRASGGGCVMDVGIHLVDAALWLLGFPAVRAVSRRMFGEGEALAPGSSHVEDYATIQLDLEPDVTVRIACSWRLPTGRAAIIETSVYGTEGGAAMRNVDGSFYDFVAERYRGTETERLVSPPDPWGGRALVSWARRLAAGAGYDVAVEESLRVHNVLDAVYRRREADGPR